MTVNTYTPGSTLPLVIYHSNCADGFSAAWCFWDAYKNGVEYYPGVYQETPPDVTGRTVFLVDFSYKLDVVTKMLETAKSIVLIDHHKTAIEDLAPLFSHKRFTSSVDLEKSGATLAWDYIYNSFRYPDGRPNPVPGHPDYCVPPPLLGHIEDRDLWRFKLPHTREIQANVFSFEYTFENWDKLMSMNTADLMVFTAAGAAIERKHHKDIKELVNVCHRIMVIGDYSVPAASLPYTLTSDAGHLMASEYENGTVFAACYWDTADHRVFSLRSCDNGMDVSEIAKQYGGGGHKHAAGFRVPRSHILAIS